MKYTPYIVFVCVATAIIFLSTSAHAQATARAGVRSADLRTPSAWDVRMLKQGEDEVKPPPDKPKRSKSNPNDGKDNAPNDGNAGTGNDNKPVQR